MDVREYVKLFRTFPKEGSEEYNKIKEYNQALIDKYPWLQIINQYTGKKVNSIYTELDELPDGWRIAFLEEMCEEIQRELVRFNCVDKYRILQLKEKFGALRWYSDGYPVGNLSTEFEERSVFNKKDLNLKEDEYAKYAGEKQGKSVFFVYKYLDKCKIDDIIRKYEKLSESICIDCGKPAKYRTTGWISFFCEDCKEEVKGELVEIDES